MREEFAVSDGGSAQPGDGDTHEEARQILRRGQLELPAAVFPLVGNLHTALGRIEISDEGRAVARAEGQRRVGADVAAIDGLNHPLRTVESRIAQRQIGAVIVGDMNVIDRIHGQ